MKLMPGAVSVLLLLGLLTWLLVRGFDTNATGHAATLQAVDDYALAQASLHRDVLQARAGLLRNYDSLVKALDEMRDAVARLRSQAGTLDGGPTARLAGSVAERRCIECHDVDNSPDFHKPGAFEKYWEKVAHSGKD